MTYQHVSICTKDGECPTHVFTPAGSGSWPAVIFYMDGLGIRPALLSMATRLADGGYFVLLPDLFYRAGRYEPLNPATLFASGKVREATAELMRSTDNRRAAQDTIAFIAYIDGRRDVAGKTIGTTGYCMGGAISLTIAGTYPDRIAAAASFHGGNLATDSHDSPHLLAPAIKARVYVAGAVDDRSYPPEMAERLTKAFSDAKVRSRCEIYSGALHGWTMKDFPVYSEVAAERHWSELLHLFDRELR
jgi:carboxymethylenebutenolidase